MTPYGAVDVYRNVYQSSTGGKTCVPADERSHLIMKTTPRMAKMLQWSYSKQSADSVVLDFKHQHEVSIRKSYVQKISDKILGLVAESELTTTYELPEGISEQVNHLSFSLDGTHVNMVEDGYRETMTGAISLYDESGERLHTVYVASSPEYGKESFECILAHEIEVMQEKFPDAPCIGVADGAATNWTFLAQYTGLLLIDFFHAVEYLSAFAKAIFGDKEGRFWYERQKKILKEKPSGALLVIAAMKEALKEQRGDKHCDITKKVLTYFINKSDKMNYHEYLEKKYPIGSGVIEAACKTVIGQRAKQSGMRWMENGLNSVLATRGLVLTEGRWEQFWKKYMAA